MSSAAGAGKKAAVAPLKPITPTIPQAAQIKNSNNNNNNNHSGNNINTPSITTDLTITDDFSTTGQRKSIQDVVITMPQFSNRLEQALREQLSDVINPQQNGLSSDPLYNPTFDPIAYINEYFPNEESLTNDAVQVFLEKTKGQISTISNQLRHELRAQAVNTTTLQSAKSKDQAQQQKQNQLALDTDTGDDTMQQQLQMQQQQQQQQQQNTLVLGGKDLHEVIQETNTQVASLFDHIKTIKKTAAPSEQLVAQICVDISALDLAKQHLQRTSTGLRNLHMLISTTSRLADAVHQKDFAECVTLIDDVDSLSSFFRPYKKIEKIRIVLSQIDQLKQKICNEASTLIRRTVILNVPAHTVESFPPGSEKAVQYRDALQVIKLVDKKEEKEIRTLWCEEILSPYQIAFTKNQDVIGLQHMDRRLAWFRREFKRALQIYDHIFPYGYQIWHYLLSQFALLTKQHVQSYLNVFSKVSYLDIINTSGVGYTTYYYEYNNATNNHPRLSKIVQGRKRKTIPPQAIKQSEIPSTPAHCIDEASVRAAQQQQQAAQGGNDKRGGFLGSLTSWADIYSDSPNQTGNSNPTTNNNNNNKNNNNKNQDDGGLTLSLEDFGDDDSTPQQKAHQHNNNNKNNKQNSHLRGDGNQDPEEVLGKVYIANEKSIPQLVNAVSKTLVFEREMNDKLTILTQEHNAMRQYQRYHQPFVDAFGKNGNNNTNNNNNNDDDCDDDDDDNSLPLTEISGIFEPFMYNLVIVERSMLLQLVNDAISAESWVPNEIHPRPRYPSCDQLLFYIKRSIDNISRVCSHNILVLLFTEYVNAIRHYLNVLVIKSDLHYLRYVNYYYLSQCLPSLQCNPAGYTISGVTTNILQHQDNTNTNTTTGNNSSSNNNNTGKDTTTSNIVPGMALAMGQTTTLATSTASANTSTSKSGGFLTSWTAGYMGGGSSSTNNQSKYEQQLNQQLLSVQHPNTVQTVEQFITLITCFNTADHIVDILPSFIAKLQEKLGQDPLNSANTGASPLPPNINSNELDIMESGDIALGYLKQNIWLYSASRLYQELSMLPRFAWGSEKNGGNNNNNNGNGNGNNNGRGGNNTQDGFSALKDKAKQANNNNGDMMMMMGPHGADGTMNTGNGDVNIYALSTCKFLKFFASYAQVLFTPAYYSAFVKYLSQRLFPDILNAILTCRNIKLEHAQQMSVDVYTLTQSVKNVFNYQLDLFTYNNAAKSSSGRTKPGMDSHKVQAGMVDDAALVSSTSIVSPQIFLNSPNDAGVEANLNSVVYKYPLIEIPAQANTASVRIFMRWVTKEITMLDNYTKIISGSTPQNIIHTISIYLGDDCTDDIVLSLFNVIGIHLTEQRRLLSAYREIGKQQQEKVQQEALAKQQKEQEDKARREKQLADASGISKK